MIHPIISFPSLGGSASVDGTAIAPSDINTFGEVRCSQTVGGGEVYWFEFRMDSNGFGHCDTRGVADAIKINTVNGSVGFLNGIFGDTSFSGRVGVGSTSNDNEGLFRVNKDFTSTSGNHHAAIVDAPDATLAAGCGVACITAGTALTSPNNCDHLAQFQVLGGHAGTGTLDSMYCFISLPYQQGGALTNLSHFEARNVTGTGDVTTQIGFLIKSLTRGTTNKAIVTEGTTPSDFGGLVKIGSGLTTLSGLGTASAAGASARGFITDSNAAASGNFGAVAVGGGSNKVPVYSDGTDWRIG